MESQRAQREDAEFAEMEDEPRRAGKNQEASRSTAGAQ
jgi:hypothetical protein